MSIKSNCRAILAPDYFNNWFSDGAMRWFNTRLIERSTANRPDGFYFVTHETREPFTSMRGIVTPGKSGYTLRRCTPDGIDTIGGLMQYKTHTAALASINGVTL